MKKSTQFLWQLELPQRIEDALISDTNPQGHITINDLELAGLLLNWLEIESTHPTFQLEHILNFCDNVSAVSWAQKMKSPASIAAGTLLCMLSLRIQSHKAYSVAPLHVAEKDK